MISGFIKAFAEDKDTAVKILFYARDIRGGLGERRIFRVILNWLALNYPETVIKNIELVPEYGRYDDLLSLLNTPCESSALELIKKTLANDIKNNEEGAGVSLLAKWLPSINASNKDTVSAGKKIAKLLNMDGREYRKTLSSLRAKIRIIENDLREKDYTFEYSAQPSKALLKYRGAFLRNDRERYIEFLNAAAEGKAKMNTGALYPYEIVEKCLLNLNGFWWSPAPHITADERLALDVTWNSLPDFTKGENALVVCDGSGSMYNRFSQPMSISIAMSLAIYYAERNKGAFHNNFITFSESPQLVEIKGDDIKEKAEYCSQFNEVANTNIQAVFELILNAALKHNVPQSEMPAKIYIISDMEFDSCTRDADATNFEYAKELFKSHGYKLPEIVFWNVASRRENIPVKMNEQGVTLVSGMSPTVFSIATEGLTPYEVMMNLLSSPRYKDICA